MIRLELPLPPTTNNLFAQNKNGRRFKSPIYTQWQWMAMEALSRQKVDHLPRGPFRFAMTVPEDMRGDVDNRIKPALDFCVAHAITPDDKHAVSVSAARGDVKSGFCIITVESVANES